MDCSPIFLETEITLKSHIYWLDFCLSPPRDSVFHKGRNLARLSPVLHSVWSIIGTHDTIERMSLDNVNVELEL